MSEVVAWQRNPFFVLSSSPRESEEELHLALDRALSNGVDEQAANEAFQSLLVPRRRLAAEVRWFPGVDPKVVRYCFSAIEHGDYSEVLRVAGTLPDVAASTLASALLPLNDDLEATLEVLLESHKSQLIAGTLKLVNQDRAAAGVSPAREDLVAAELRLVADEHMVAAAAVVGALVEPERLLSVLVEERVTEKDGAFSFVEKLCERLEAQNHTRLGHLNNVIDVALARIKTNPTDERALVAFLDAIERWDRILQPHQLLHSSRRIDEPQSLTMLRKVRSATVAIANEKGAHQVALRITEALRTHFPELPSAQQQLDEDHKTLKELVQEAEISKPIEALDQLVGHHKKNPRPLVAAMGSTVFGQRSQGVALALFRAFQGAEAASRASEHRVVPWQMMRSLAISLHNDSNEPWAAWSLTSGVLQAGVVPPDEVATALRADEKAARKTVFWLYFKAALASKDSTEIDKWSQKLIELEDDPAGREAIRRAGATAKRPEVQSQFPKIGCLLAVIAFAAFSLFNTYNSNKRTESSSGKEAVRKRTAAVAPYPYPEWQLPPTGVISDLRFGRDEAPFEVTTRAGGGHIFMKVVDTSSDLAIVTAFVRAGATLRVDMPLGNYRLRYASGGRWYGTEHLFGAETSYSEADQTMRLWSDGLQTHGYSIELIPRAGGNLRERRIAPGNF